jgi:hypothetical protein
MSMSKSSLPAATTCPFTLQGASPRRVRGSLLPLALLALPTALASASCLDPHDDFNAYVARAADAEVPTSPIGTAGDAGAFDAASLRPPDAGFDDTRLVMICVSSLAEDISNALLWEAHLTYTGGSNGGTLDYVTNSLAAGATDINSPLPDSTISVMATPVDSHGAAPVTVGSATLPAAANAITSGAVPLQNVTIYVQLEGSQICANLEADVTAPAKAHLDPADNPCIYLPVDNNGQWGPVTTTDVHCP